MATDISIEIPNSQETPIVKMQRISDAPEIMQMRDPMAKQNLITTARIHQRQTQNNRTRSSPKIYTSSTSIDPARSKPDSHGEVTIDQETRHHVAHDHHPACVNTKYQEGSVQVHG